MSIATVYVRAESKKALNDALAENQHAFEALKFDVFTGNDVFNLETLPVGTVIKVFDKMIHGIPYAKAYGTLARRKDGKVYVK